MASRQICLQLMCDLFFKNRSWARGGDIVELLIVELSIQERIKADRQAVV
ncbi:MAG: hypothetical protein KDB03_04485 [Planctomycetales bacterium]|nr:hypothetical protein [Planctomycetales bacterium]